MNSLAIVQTSRTTAVSAKSLNDKFHSHGRTAPENAWADPMVTMGIQPSEFYFDPGLERTNQQAAFPARQPGYIPANHVRMCRQRSANQKRATLDPSTIKAAVVLSSSVLLSRTAPCHQLNVVDTSAIEHSSSTSVRERTTDRTLQFDARLRE